MRSRKKAIYQFFLVMSLVSAALFIYDRFIPYRLAWNITESIPKGIYFAEKIERTRLERGSIGCFRYKAPQWAADRQYFPDGFPLCKYITGMPGDAVSRTEKTLTITPSDASISATSVAYDKTDRIGRHLEPALIETGYLKSGEYLLIAPRYTNSFDSRYVGIIKQNDIELILTPLITW